MEDVRGTQAADALDPETLEFVRAVFAAVRAGEAEPLAPLLARGLPPNLRNEKGDSLLMLASYHGRHAVADLLLRHGADPELRNDRGQSPLQGAAFQGDVAMVELLLGHGASLDATGPDGRTALTMAAMFDRMEVLEVLLARGADHRVRDAAGLTALDAARTMGAARAAQRLGVLERGAG